ncbi:MAG: energy transducer TonB [Acidobacteriota bacterium]|nr:MAG: energy transducer TonB [Acidobacteriota bacterium]
MTGVKPMSLKKKRFVYSEIPTASMADKEKTGDTSRPQAGDKTSPTSRVDLSLLLAIDPKTPKRIRRVTIVALLFHLLLPLFFLIESKEVVQETKEPIKHVITLIKIIPPPKIPPPPQEKVNKDRRPVPDPTPDEPEPIREPEPPEIIIPPGVDVVIGIPKGPPAPVRPLTAGVAGTTQPMRVHYVEPEYPEEAKRVGLEGNVILNVTVDERGNVADVAVIEGGPLGMTEKAVEAVWKWKYEPSTLHGMPISLSFTAVVWFTLQ